ncbi:putative tRNA (cytidine(34)-2'-O)-methyltransferase isoform X2 [Benincasa hispida]|uniref:putative tRNA (cytidine(34)-2'-O)-methyltransferase isoform X2 n=1 Tax=Benincasa hispida TaxID=102211 RepID=UPI0019005829|nr:putative tRNA (cytidine(34)-2'-O)-methyltransferase isoform X2 [Benincasa hispida]
MPLMDTATVTLRTLNPFPPFQLRSSRPHHLLRPHCFSHFTNKQHNPSSSSSFHRLLPFCSLSERVEGSGSLPSGVGEAVNGVSQPKLLQVVLVSPLIPGNTGSIARTCAASAVGLHLVGPLGFKVDDTKLKRAGLDYWPYVVVKIHHTWADFRDYFMKQEGEKRLLAFTKRGTTLHSDFSYKRGDYLLFGSETSGLPAEALEDCKNQPFGGGTLRIPMVETYVRCLNLSVSVGIAIYEASRQLNYEQLQQVGSESCTGNEQSIITEDLFA